MQRTTSNPPTGFLTSAGSVSQLASSISQSKNAGSLRLSHLVLYAVFNILSEASEDVRLYPSSINMTESTPVPHAASRIFSAFFCLSRFNKKFLQLSVLPSCSPIYSSQFQERMFHYSLKPGHRDSNFLCEAFQVKDTTEYSLLKPLCLRHLLLIKHLNYVKNFVVW